MKMSNFSQLTSLEVISISHKDDIEVKFLRNSRSYSKAVNVGVQSWHTSQTRCSEIIEENLVRFLGPHKLLVMKLEPWKQVCVVTKKSSEDSHARQKNDMHPQFDICILLKPAKEVCLPGIILCMCPANESWCYNVTSSLIG